MHNQSGFSLFEFLINILISATLMTISLTIYSHISKSTTTIQRITQWDSQAMILRHRLSADLDGICPLWFTKQLYDDLKKNNEKDKQNKGMESEPIVSTNPNSKHNTFLYAQTTANDQLDLLTFVTVNALQTYGNNKRCVRVVYKLMPDEQHQNLYKLMRKEDDAVSPDLDLSQIKNGAFFEIAHHITKCNIEYGFIEPTTQQREKKPGQALSLKWVTRWDPEQGSTKKMGESPELPEFIKLKISFLHSPDKPSIDYEIYCFIPINQQDFFTSFAEQRAKKNNPAPKTSPAPVSGK